MTNTRLPNTCSGCLLSEANCTGFMPAPEGKGLIPLMLVGDTLTEAEAKDSLPFRPYAEAGSLLQRALNSVGIQREQVVLTNLIHCRPPNNKFAGEYYEQEAVSHCRQYLDAEVAKFRPKAILALGAIPFKYLTGMSGHKQNLEYVRGYPVESIWYPGIPVIGTFHPSFIRRGASEMFPVLVHDLHKALQIAKGKQPWQRDEQVNYQVGSTQELQHLLEQLRANPTTLLAYDIETRESAKTTEDEYDSLSVNADIELVQFSIAPYTGLAVYWNADTIPLIREIFATANPKSAFNGWLFDNRILEAKGIQLNGEIKDAMGAWHHLQPDLPANLQFVASFYCLAASTKIPLWNGESATIRDIVNLRLAVVIKGMDDKGRVIPVTITDWHKQLNIGQLWTVIKTHSHKQPIYCTPDHKIYTNKGWVLAEDVIPGMIIYQHKSGSEDLIHGMLMGDGHVGRNNMLKTTHSKTQEDYAEAKAASLDCLDTWRERTEDNFVSVSFSTRISSYWRNKFYPEGYKVFVPPVSVAALAIWYCDDGSWKKFNDRKGGDGTAVLAIKKTYDATEVINWLRGRFGDNVRLGDYASGRQAYMGVASRDKFFTTIAPWVPPSMQRKLPPSYRGRYNGWLEQAIARQDVISEVVHNYRCPGVLREYNTRYCITVDHPTHRFFTEGGLVSNCMNAPWKHTMTQDLTTYGIKDVDAVQRIESKINHDLAQMKLLDGYTKYVVGLRPILKDMEDRGIGRDQQAIDELRIWIEQEKIRLNGEIQQLAPIEIKPVQTWTSWPQDLSEARKTWAEANLVTPVSEKTGKPLKPRVPIVKLEDAYNIDDLVMAIGEAGYSWKPNGKELFKRLPFLPGSTQHLMAYLRNKSIPIPKNLDDKETTGRSELDKLIKKLNRSTKPNETEAAAFINKVLEYRKLHKVLATYIDGWKNGADGRIHTTFTFLPATGQLCLAKGTLIETVRDVSKYPKGVPIEDVKVGDLVYSFDENKRLTTRKVLRSGKTGRKKCLRIHWKGRGNKHTGYIDMTPEHPVRLIDGSYILANALVVGDRTLALSRGISSWGYGLLYATGHQEMRDHRFLYKDIYGDLPEHVHHINENKLDNRIENLQGMIAVDHISMHSKEAWTPERKAKQSQISKENWSENSKRMIRHGKDCANYLNLSKEWMLEVLWENAGKPTVFTTIYGIDYETALKYMKMHEIDYRSIAAEFNGKDQRITKQLVEQGRYMHNRFGSEVARQHVCLGWTRWKEKQLQYGFDPYNHQITKIEELPLAVDVYDLTVEGTHNFIANEICVHNSSRNPNVQNVGKGSELAKRFRRTICPAPGNVLVEADYKSFHALTLGFEAQDPDYMRLARLDCHSFVAAHLLKLPEAVSGKLIEMSDAEMLDFFKWFKSDPTRKLLRDKKAKPCLAEGTLILTSNGLKPIQTVSLDDLVWDGIEWVQHSGVIYQGLKEVITYNGITGTKDHKVVCSDGTICTLEEAKAQAKSLDRTELVGQPIRTSNGNFLENYAQERLSLLGSDMLGVSSNWFSQHGKLSQWKNKWLRSMHAQKETAYQSSVNPRQSLRLNVAAMYKSFQCSMGSLWRSRYPTAIQFTTGIYSMDGNESTLRGLHLGRDRQDGQQFTLHAGEFALSDKIPTDEEQAEYLQNSCSWKANSFSGLAGMSLRNIMGNAFNKTGNDYLRDDNSSLECEQGKSQGDGKIYAKVYDIANAGSRFCYTASGFLVLNCILGIGFGLGKHKLFNMNEDSFANEAEAGKVISLIRGIFPKVFEFQERVKQLAYKQGWLRSRWGFVRRFSDVYRYNSRSQGLTAGVDAEACIAFLPANSAFGKVREAMIDFEREGLNVKYNCVSSVHDSIIFDVPKPLLDEALARIKEVMERPATVLVDPITAPQGLHCEVELSISDKSWADLQEVKGEVPPAKT